MVKKNASFKISGKFLIPTNDIFSVGFSGVKLV